MRAQALGGLGLLASAMLCLAGTLTASTEVMWGAGAWAGVAATATVYRDVARHAGRGRAAVALALLGVVASAWLVEATLRVTGGRWVAAQSVPRLALAYAAAVGIALLAYGLARAGLVRPTAGAVIAFAALLGPLTGDPGAPYLLGAGPLGAALLAGAIRTCRTRPNERPAPYGTKGKIVMTNPNFSSWQSQQNANQNAARAAQWARQSTQDSARLARRSGRSSFVGNVIALLIVIAVLVIAAPFVLEIIARVGF